MKPIAPQELDVYPMQINGDDVVATMNNSPPSPPLSTPSSPPPQPSPPLQELDVHPMQIDENDVITVIPSMMSTNVSNLSPSPPPPQPQQNMPQADQLFEYSTWTTGLCDCFSDMNTLKIRLVLTRGLAYSILADESSKLWVIHHASWRVIVTKLRKTVRHSIRLPEDMRNLDGPKISHQKKDIRNNNFNIPRTLPNPINRVDHSKVVTFHNDFFKLKFFC